VSKEVTSRRHFLKVAGTVTGAGLFGSKDSLGLATERAASGQAEGSAPDYTLHIAASPVEIAPKHIVSANTYNGQVPGRIELNHSDRTGKRAARFNPTSKFATSLPVFGCCARGTAKRLREMALVGKTCLERDTRNGFAAT